MRKFGKFKVGQARISVWVITVFVIFGAYIPSIGKLIVTQIDLVS